MTLRSNSNMFQSTSCNNSLYWNALEFSFQSTALEPTWFLHLLLLSRLKDKRRSLFELNERDRKIISLLVLLTDSYLLRAKPLFCSYFVSVCYHTTSVLQRFTLLFHFGIFYKRHCAVKLDLFLLCDLDF